jgi:hypothetical protein
MPRYLRGSKGEEVRRIQQRLQELGLYAGEIDGDFGGGTEIAVRRFQRASGLSVDGIVGPDTWRALCPGEPEVPAPALLRRPVEFRCLALTGAFETSMPPPGCFACVSGDFDGEGISFGALQFNLGQRTLQPILQEMDRRHPALMTDIFGRRLERLRTVLAAPLQDQLAFARSVQNPRFRLDEPWRGMFKTLGRSDECQRIQLEAAAKYAERAKTMCARFGVGSARGLALMFDIVVQNGSIGREVGALIDRDIAALPFPLEPDERQVAQLLVIANRRAEAATPRWVEDVRARKLCIANGEGRVHGAYYHLEEQYGLALQPAGILSIN